MSTHCIEPAQGVDTRSRQQIFRLKQAAAESECGMELASTEYEDLVHLGTEFPLFHSATSFPTSVAPLVRGPGPESPR